MNQLQNKVKDLQSKGWFYGPISRSEAVGLLNEDGEFLVRDCISCPGAYVLTCRHTDKILHFRINQIIERDVEEKVTHYYYQFEDDCFASVEELIFHYVQTGKPVSLASGALITSPKDRFESCPEHLYAPLQKNGFSAAARAHVRSHSSMSSGALGPTSSPTPSHVTHRSDGQVMLKSGSRASLLTNGADETDSTKSSCGAPAELKRYKSLPGDKLLNRQRRRVKRRAPSPPKDRPRYCPPPLPAQATCQAVEVTERKKMPQTLDLPKVPDGTVVSTGGFVSGVRLRRKKFQLFNRAKPMNFMQRQTVYFGAKLDEKLWQLGSLKSDERRYSLPRITSSDSEDDTGPWKPNGRDHQALVRSPSDSSLMYLNQLGLKAKSDKMSFVRSSRKLNGKSEDHVEASELSKPEMKLPAKKRIFLCNGNGNDGISPNESIYDSVPKPRSCLREDQLKYSDLYDVPRKLLAPQELRAGRQKTIQNFPSSSPTPRLFSYDCGAPWLSGDGRSVSVLCSRQLPNKNADSSSSCGNRQLISSSASLNVQHCKGGLNEDATNENNTSLNRHGNYFDLHNLRDDSPVVPVRLKDSNLAPKLPPKRGRMFELPTNGGDGHCDSVIENDDDKSSIVDSYTEQTDVDTFVKDRNADNLCCTSCDNKRRSVDLNSTTFNDNMSGTNFEDCEPRTMSNFTNENLSDEEEDSLSLLELQRDLTPYQLSQHGNIESNNGTSPLPQATSDTMSTLSSVSSMTLQADDMSFTTYDDTTSLPDDPFPQGLPSLCLSSNEDLSSSSTLGSDPHLPRSPCKESLTVFCAVEESDANKFELIHQKDLSPSPPPQLLLENGHLLTIQDQQQQEELEDREENVETPQSFDEHANFYCQETREEKCRLSADSPTVSQHISEDAAHLGMTGPFLTDNDENISNGGDIEAFSPSAHLTQTPTASPVLSGPFPDENDLNLRTVELMNTSPCSISLSAEISSSPILLEHSQMLDNSGEQEMFDNQKFGQHKLFENVDEHEMLKNKTVNEQVMFESVKGASSLFGVPPKARSADPLSGGRCYCFITTNGFDDITDENVTSFSNGRSHDQFSNARSLDRLSRDTRQASRSRYSRHLSPSPPSDCTPPPTQWMLPTNGFEDHQPQFVFSQFDPVNFQTLFLPGTGNKPLDPLAVRAIHRTLVEMSAENLAAHLTTTDLEFFGLNDFFEENYLRTCHFPENEETEIKSKFSTLSDFTETGRIFRQDTLDRCLCLRTLVIVTILTAPNLSESAKILSRWILVADQVLNRFGDRFAFFSIVSVCCLSKHLQRWRDLWTVFDQLYCNEAQKLETILRPQLNLLSHVSLETTSVPHLLPFILRHHQQQTKKSFLSDLRKEASTTQADCEEVSFDFIEAENTFRQNGAAFLTEIDGGAPIFEQLLLDLFRTEFHVKLLWGSGSGVLEFPANFEIRHAKFAKVISTLAAICTRT